MAMKDKRRLTGYRDELSQEPESVYDDYQNEDVYEQYDGDSDGEVDENGQVLMEDEDDSGSELSIPDAEIDFKLVYALHTFKATVEGQATVFRGNALTLLDDSNSYWWLVKVLKSSEVGYIPAENIETPHERLARLNSHRNIEITRKDNFDVFPIPPTNKPKGRKRVTLAKAVQYQSQLVYGNSSDEASDAFESEFQHWNEAMDSSDSNSDTSLDSDGSEGDDPYQYYGEQGYADAEATEHGEDDVPTLESHLSADSDIINDPKDYLYCEEPVQESGEVEGEEVTQAEEETLKISLTPQIARDLAEPERHSDSSLPSKLKKAAKLEKLLVTSPQEKKKTSGIRKFFSRGKKKEERRLSSSTLEDTLSIGSSQSSLVRDHRVGSLDSQNAVRHLKVLAGMPLGFSEAWVDVEPQTTSADLIHQLLAKEATGVDTETYQDYYLMVKTPSGDECTLIPTDRPLEIFYSLTAHLNTPMPSLKKARRISQLMGSENHMGGPAAESPAEEVQFFLFSKTKRMEDGEFQIKVSLLPCDQVDERNKRVDKLVKIPCSMLIKDATALLLEKFHLLNGVVADMTQDEERIQQELRLGEASTDLIQYSLVMCVLGKERRLPNHDTLLTVFGDDVPPIHYRRNSHPDRSSITTHTTPPEKNETFFLLKRIEKPNSSTHTRPHHPLIRQDTPMPRKEPTLEGFEPLPAMLCESPSGPEDSQSHSSEQTVTPRRIRPTSTESMLFCTDDFGMNDLMVLIRGAALHQPPNPSLRTEIGDLFKDSQSRLEQLEKELDRIMLEAIKVYH
ncbi:hypothetical protein BY458DRAFT_557845 [Sporodiniella umbellata]|nr:hypothetical protein BY458DRAFT_557845 [Sporodiniella umbellata]